MNKAELAWQFDKEGMKCSRSMLSQYLNGKYPSRPVKLEERLERWLEETEEQEAAFRQEKPQVAFYLEPFAEYRERSCTGCCGLQYAGYYQ